MSTQLDQIVKKAKSIRSYAYSLALCSLRSSSRKPGSR